MVTETKARWNIAAATALMVLLTGCCSPARQRFVVNNTGYILDVRQDNQRIAVLRNGEQCALDDNWLIPRTTVTVTGRTETGGYVGAESWIFCSGTPEIWQINELRKPQPSR